MKKIAAILFVWMVSLPLFSKQNVSFSTDFGRYENSDFEFARYDKDTLAEAVYLYDIGETLYDFDSNEGSFNLVFTRHFRIKIFNKAGLNQSVIRIPIYCDKDRMEEVINVKGLTYNRDGDMIQKTELNPDNVFVENLSGNWKIKKFAMPDVREGSIMEVEYTVKSPFKFNFHNWEFQQDIPVIYSEYKVHIIPFYTYTFLLQGANRFDGSTSYEASSEQVVAGIKYRDMIYDYVMRDVGAFPDEPYITCQEDYLIKLKFQLCEFNSPDGNKISYLSTWPKFCNDLLTNDYFGKVMKTAEKKSEKMIEEMGMTSNTSMEKAKLIYDYVVSSFKWNGVFSKYSDVAINNLLKNRTGDAADINLFMIGMLRAAGIETYPVLISTRDHGRFKVDYPFDFFFNYVIAALKMDNQYILLDATEPYIGFGAIPARCVNEKGFLIKDKKTFEWLSLGNGATSKTNYAIDLSPVPGSDLAKCFVRMVSDGYLAMDLRKECYQDRKHFEGELVGKDLKLIDTVKVQNLSNVQSPLQLRFNATLAQSMVGDALLIKPFCGLIPSGNPFINEKRYYPIDLIYKRERSFTSTIHIPDGYKVARIPEVSIMDDTYFRLSFTTKFLENNILLIEASYEYKNEQYPPSLYASVKKFSRAVDEMLNMNLSLTKIQTTLTNPPTTLTKPPTKVAK
jgi:hypothetical protein